MYSVNLAVNVKNKQKLMIFIVFKYILTHCIACTVPTVTSNIYIAIKKHNNYSRSLCTCGSGGGLGISEAAFCEGLDFFLWDFLYCTT